MSNHHDIFEEKKVDPLDEVRLELFNQSFIALMKSRHGRRFVWGVLGQTGFAGQPFTGQRETTDFNCGQRNLGVWLFTLIDQFCPENFSLMMKESKEDTNDYGQLNTSSSGGNTASGSTGSSSSSGSPNPADSIAIIGSPSS